MNGKVFWKFPNSLTSSSFIDWFPIQFDFFRFSLLNSLLKISWKKKRSVEPNPTLRSLTAVFTFHFGITFHFKVTFCRLLWSFSFFIYSFIPSLHTFFVSLCFNHSAMRSMRPWRVVCQHTLLSCPLSLSLQIECFLIFCSKSGHSNESRFLWPVFRHFSSSRTTKQYHKEAAKLHFCFSVTFRSDNIKTYLIINTCSTLSWGHAIHPLLAIHRM